MEDQTTYVRKGRKKPRISRRIAAITALLSVIMLISPSAVAQGIEQFQKHTSIGGRLPTSILILGWKQDEPDIDKLFDIVIGRTNEVFYKLDWQNPQGEVARINANAGIGQVLVSPEVLAAFQAAKKSSEWSNGAFDIAYAGQGNYRDIKIKSGESAVELKKSGMQVRFDSMMEGFLADLMLQYIYTANMRHAIVKVGGVFRGMGKSLYGPWKIQVEDDAGMFAHHALNLTVVNTGVATVSANQYRGVPVIDPRTKSPIPISMKGTVVVMNQAALAQGIAQAVFILGPAEGLKLLSKMGKGLIVDNNGKFIRTQGF